MRVLVTGGAGYIGSHTCLELLKKDYEVIVVDNLSNSNKVALKRVQELANKKIVFYEIDITNRTKLEEVFINHKIDAVIHFAGLKSVSESICNPIEYYTNNLLSSLVLFELMKLYNVKKLVFSSSATVYGIPKEVPIKENANRITSTPYGETKIMIEKILEDIHLSDNAWSIVLLRYFNPIGADDSGLIGEDPRGIPNNLMPYICQVASGKLEKLNIYGDTYKTIDGTGVRDYIHVSDLAKGHIKAIEYSFKGVEAINLGTGKGFSVLELVNTFERTNNISVKFEIVAPRNGDIAECYADVSKATKLLNWRAEKSLEDMCKDSWNWQSKNINGY